MISWDTSDPTKNLKKNRIRKFKIKNENKKVKDYFPTLINKKFHNISSFQVSNKTASVLGLGLNFIPEPPLASEDTLMHEFDNFADIIRIRKKYIHLQPTEPCKDYLAEAFHNIKWKHKKSVHKKSPDSITSSWVIENYIAEAKSNLLKEIRHFNPKRLKRLERKQKFTSNRSIILNAVNDLSSNPNVIIKSADKNLGLCLMDTSWYNEECLRQLQDANTYSLITTSPNFKVIMLELQNILFKYN